jgi:hypothetical protein
MYASFTLEQITERWNRVQGEVQERKNDLAVCFEIVNMC